MYNNINKLHIISQIALKSHLLLHLYIKKKKLKEIHQNRNSGHFRVVG